MSGITVSGHGEARGRPDTVRAGIGVSALRKSVRQATGVAADRIAAVLAALAEHDVSGTDIRTSAYTVGPQWDHRGNEPRIVGYRVEHMLVVRIGNIDATGEVLDSVIAAGGDETRINNVAFAIEDDAALAATARTAAWHAARTKAEQLAALAGLTLGAATTINETSAGPQPMMRAAAVAERGATPVMAGERSVTVGVTVTFELAAQP